MKVLTHLINIEGDPMPALMTHNFFAQDVLDRNNHGILGDSARERAFYIGSQGPDPLFAVLEPAFRDIGSRMHAEKPAELLTQLAHSLQVLSPDDAEIGRAYLLGFACHYVLDSHAHPFIYAQQYAICDAGVSGLDRTKGTAVHHTMERELDEAILFAKTGKTVAQYPPVNTCLSLGAHEIHIISKMIAYTLVTTYDIYAPEHLFAEGLTNMRAGYALIYSPQGAKRTLIGALEHQLFGTSLASTLSHRDRADAETPFANTEHTPWTNPFTGDVHTESFWDLYAQAQDIACNALNTIDRNDFDIHAAEALTRGLNFSGAPTFARLEVEE